MRGIVTGFTHSWMLRVHVDALARLAQQIGDGEASLKSAASVAAIYGSNVFRSLDSMSAIFYLGSQARWVSLCLICLQELHCQRWQGLQGLDSKRFGHQGLPSTILVVVRYFVALTIVPDSPRM